MPDTSFAFGRALAAMASCLFVMLAPTHAAGAACDPDLRPPRDTPYAYRQRGAVCEGLYARDIAGRAVVVVGLTSRVDEFTAADGTDLLLDAGDAPGAAGTPIHLRAEALRPKLYYRMDAEALPAALPVRWSPQVLKALTLTGRELGLLAWTEQRIAGESRRVLQPVRLRLETAPAPPDTAPWQLTVLPTDELDELYFSVMPLDEQGADTKALVEDRALARGFYPPYRPVSIELPALPGAGLYRIDLAASLRAGGSATDRIWVRGDGR